MVGWNVSIDCCEWPGISCDLGGLGRVIGLDLSSEEITGEKGLDDSTALFSLQYLESLDLSYNEFNTTIPVALGNLTNLRYLNLSYAGFFGKIPTSISQLTSLISLNLSCSTSCVKKLEIANLALLVQNLTQLTHLRLDRADLSAQGKKWCHVLSSSLPNLKVLSLANCSLSGPIDPSLSKLQSLSRLELDHNNFSSPIPDSLAELKNLTLLKTWYSMEGWNESSDCCEWPGISCDLGDLGRVIGLDLSLEGITGGEGLDDSMALFSLQYLESLDLSNNEFNTTIPAAIGNLTNLSLSNCSLSGPIDPSLSKLQSLSILELDYNNFSSQIPDSLAELKNLTVLRLRNCELIGTFPKKIVESLTLLEELDLSNNHLQGPIPRSLSELPSLYFLDLSSNRFRGSVQLSWFQTLQNLTWLDLSYNNLTVDTSINNSSPSSTFPQLETVYLRSCNLRTFPELGNLSELSDLDLSDNNINGVVPRWIMESTTLEYLNLSHNNLVGFEVHRFSSSRLQLLDMHDNQLEGNLPFIPSPYYLDFSHNHFSGSFPTEIFNNQDPSLYLSFLSLSNNRLTGFIPTSICNLANLEVVDFSNNNLNGTIPSCLSKDLKYLSVLDLRGNMFSGKIPDTFHASYALQTLDLSNNQLEGRIPKSLENCTMLEVLDVGNNKISDVFPCIQGIKSSLRVLILRNNLFHGSLSCSYGDLTTWQQLQIVDLAFNNFSGPLNDKFLLTWEAMMQDRKETHDIIHFQPERRREYYRNSITVSMKGLKLELVKILTIFKSIDLSSNNFDGPIPEVIGKFKAILVLNLSHNAFSGQIPSEFGNLSNVESLDLSHNKLTGKIPNELTGLTFLSCMDLSYNNLVGKIPTGTQFQSFDNTSFGGNLDLYSRMVEWNASTDCCEWPGISCDPGGLGRVIGLDLSREWITGGGGLDDSTALFSLQYLESLDLSNNEFNTTIPAAIGNLTNLRYLDLSSAGFFGKIPTSISQLTSLTSLNLSCWGCDKKLEISNLALLVKNLTQLTDLLLDEVDLSPQGKEWGHVLSSSLPNLKVLSLANCSLSGPIDPSLSKLQSLSILELDHNNFSSQIPDSLAEFKNLTTLSMSNCGLIGTFPKKIAQSLTLLEYLDLSNNHLQGPISHSLSELPSLQFLLLSSNRFRGSVQLSWFQTLQNLAWLDLSYNNLTVDASINNSSPSSTFPHLQFLVLRSCNLRTFPELGNLSELSELQLSDNNISGVVPRWIMESTTLIHLNLAHNNLVGFEVHRFSSRYFTVFDMHDNQFEGNLPFIPSTYYLDISHNHFSGSFPTEIFNNHSSFPTEIFNNQDPSVYLSFLSLSNNRLTGTIPTSICNQAGLQVVDFSNNYFNGTIPSCLSKDLNGLSVLDLRGNMLSGNIPNTFQDSCALQTLDLSNNQLEGRFPESLENCTNLEVLDVGYNKISDVFPCIQGIKSSLHVLILRNNLFHGSLWCRYGDLTTWKQLQIVDLAFNNFSGPLNDKFLLTWEAMMQDRKETNDIIHFQPQRSGEYYRNSVTITI
ncbi:Receptor-like protein 50 [Linum perenne]